MAKWHIGFSIDGLLSQSDYRLKKLAPCCRVDGVQLKTAGQVKRMLREAKSAGMIVIPAEECDNYDERGYCRGHGNT